MKDTHLGMLRIGFTSLAVTVLTVSLHWPSYGAEGPSEVTHQAANANEQKNDAGDKNGKDKDAKPTPIPIPPNPSSVWEGLHFGVGVSGTLTLGRDRIDSAKVVNGIVRVDGEKNFLPRVMLESHWFSPTCMKDVERICHGPFVALQPGTNNIIDAIGIGWMWGLPFGLSSGSERKGSWNIGAGVTAEPNAKTLGDGINKNQPLPSGESSTEVRTQNRTLLGVMILMSLSF